VSWRLSIIHSVLRLREPGVRRLYERTAVAPEYLTIEDLGTLAREYPVQPSVYSYDTDAREERAEERAQIVLPLVSRPSVFVEIGARDGMVLWAIAKRGHTAIAVDIESGLLDPRARDVGVQFIQTDATQLCFPDNSVDVVCTFGTFEHLPDPEATFVEIIRVLKPGGHAYIDFAGLGWTYRGAHMYKSIGIPFITALFRRETIEQYAAEQQLPRDFPYVNNWPIERYRTVFKKYAREMEELSYRETKDRFHFAFLRRFMSHARRAPSFDSLLVDQVQGLFRKRRRTA
jgi:ubiquinone/menaquinone biosynthesis C-methylase UbiE